MSVAALPGCRRCAERKARVPNPLPGRRPVGWPASPRDRRCRQRRFRAAVLVPLLSILVGAEHVRGGGGSHADSDTAGAAGQAAVAADAAERSWTWLAEEVGWSDADALRERLPGVSATDIEWVRAAMAEDSRLLEQPGVTADAMLAEPGYQAMRKALSAIRAISMIAVSKDTAALTRLFISGAVVPELQALDSALWAAYGDQLGEYARQLREQTGTGTTMFLWIRHAAKIDQDALERLRVSAHDLLQMADYQLARKLAADAHVKSLVACVRCATPSAPYYDDDCRAPNDRRCALSAAGDLAALCAGYLSRVVNPASGLARCPVAAADIATDP